MMLSSEVQAVELDLSPDVDSTIAAGIGFFDHDFRRGQGLGLQVDPCEQFIAL
jgi:hypothetical protein